MLSVLPYYFVFGFLIQLSSPPSPATKYCCIIPKTVKVFQYKDKPTEKFQEKNPIITGNKYIDCFWKVVAKSSCLLSFLTTIAPFGVAGAIIFDCKNWKAAVKRGINRITGPTVAKS